MDAPVTFFDLCYGPNASDGNGTSDLWLVEDLVTGYITAVFLLLILVVGLPWNLLVVITIVKEKLYHQPTIVLLLNLSISNIIMLAAMIPVQITTGFAGEYIFGSTDSERCMWCNSGAVGILFAFMNLYMIATIAFDRFLYIYKPFHYHKIISSWRMLVVVIVVWIGLISLSVLRLFGKNTVFNPPFLACIVDFSSGNISHLIIVLTLALIPIIVLAVFDLWVMVIVQRNIRAIYSIRNTLGRGKEGNSCSKELQKRAKRKQSQKQFHLIRVFGALLGYTSLIAWLPTFFLVLYLFITRAVPGEGPTRVMAAFRVFYISQLAVQPIIETVLIKDVRVPMKKLVFCLCFGKQRDTVDDACKISTFWRNSCLCHSCEFLSILKAALEHNKYGHSEREDSKEETFQTVSTETVVPP